MDWKLYLNVIEINASCVVNAFAKYFSQHGDPPEFRELYSTFNSKRNSIRILVANDSSFLLGVEFVAINLLIYANYICNTSCGFWTESWTVKFREPCQEETFLFSLFICTKKKNYYLSIYNKVKSK